MASNCDPSRLAANSIFAVTVEPGTTPAQIGQLLQDKAVIRSGLAFSINARLSGSSGLLKEGDLSFISESVDVPDRRAFSQR